MFTILVTNETLKIHKKLLFWNMVPTLSHLYRQYTQSSYSQNRNHEVAQKLGMT